jgi:hypothetical protein
VRDGIDAGERSVVLEDEDGPVDGIRQQRDCVTAEGDGFAGRP